MADKNKVYYKSILSSYYVLYISEIDVTNVPQVYSIKSTIDIGKIFFAKKELHHCLIR